MFRNYEGCLMNSTIISSLPSLCDEMNEEGLCDDLISLSKEFVDSVSLQLEDVLHKEMKQFVKRRMESEIRRKEKELDRLKSYYQNWIEENSENFILKLKKQSKVSSNSLDRLVCDFVQREEECGEEEEVGEEQDEEEEEEEELGEEEDAEDGEDEEEEEDGEEEEEEAEEENIKDQDNGVNIKSMIRTIKLDHEQIHEMQDLKNRAFH